MKRTPLKRGTSQLKRSAFKRKPVQRLRRTKLRIKGISTAAQLKDEIQAHLRQIAIKIYGTCVLSKYSEVGVCGSYTKDGNLILQAEHLNSRSHTGSFGDMRNIVLLCQRHHIYWKPQNSKRYWELIREIIGEKRWAWLKRVEQDHTPQKVDLKLTLLALKQELKKLNEN